MEYLLVVLLTDQKALSKYEVECPKCVLIISGKLLALRGYDVKIVDFKTGKQKLADYIRLATKNVFTKGIM